MSVCLKAALIQHKEIMAHSVSLLRHIFNDVLGEVAMRTPFLLPPTTCPHFFTHPVVHHGSHYCEPSISNFAP